MSTTIVNPTTVRIRRIACSVRWTAIGAMVCIVLIAGYSLVNQSTSWELKPIGTLTAHAMASPDSANHPKLAVWLELLPEAVLFYGFIRLVQMMLACERAEIFSLRVSTHLRAFSLAIVVVQLLHMTLSLQMLAVTALVGGPDTDFTLGASGEQLWSLLLAALFLMLAQILKEAARLAEDSASIV